MAANERTVDDSIGESKMLTVLQNLLSKYRRCRLLNFFLLIFGVAGVIS